MNTHVGRITRRQAIMGGFTVAYSPSPSASKDKSDDGFDSDDDDGLPSHDDIDKMFT